MKIINSRLQDQWDQLHLFSIMILMIQQPNTIAEDATVEAGVTYAVPGTKGTTISASYSNDPDEDNFDAWYTS